ncbi:MAG: FliM/FliN family flagellar motor switch protein, partial [Paracoccaceae bacterium]
LMEERLLGLFRGPAAVTVTGGRLAKLSEALETAGAPAIYGVAETPDGRLGAVLTLSAPFIQRAVAAMTGAGAQTGAIAEDRMPTAIDEALIESFARDVVDCFERAVISGPRPEGGVALRFARFARKATSLAEAPDTVDTLGFNIEIGFCDGGPAHSLVIVLPLGALDIYRAAEKAAASRPLISQFAAPGELWTSTMLAAAQTAEFRLVGVLYQMTLTVSDIGELRSGSVIPLPEGERMEVSLRIDKPAGVTGGSEIAAGVLGVSDGRRAVRITTPPDEAFIERLRPYEARRG